MKKLVVVPALLKAHVGSYTRKDGTFVQEHDDKRQAAKPSSPKPGHMDVSSLAPGHHLFDKSGQKVDEVESVEKHPMGGLRVNTRAGYSHMVSKDGQNAHGLTNKAPGGAASPKLVLPKKAAPKPTGSAAPAKMVNAGSEKWPMHVKSSEKLATKREDGSTHHVGGFKPPEYPAGGGATDGDVTIHHDGKTYSHTGKKGKNMKTGEDSYEYSHSDDRTESRAWVTRSGHLMND